MQMLEYKFLSGTLPGQGHTRAILCGVQTFSPQSTHLERQSKNEYKRAPDDPG